MTREEIIKAISVYFHWVDVEKKHRNSGFAKPRRDAEKALRRIIKEEP